MPPVRAYRTAKFANVREPRLLFPWKDTARRARKVPRSFFELRLVSKQLNNLVTPLLYWHIILNGRIIISLVSDRRFLSPHKRQVALDVRQYTWNVTLRGDFPDENLGSVFRSLKHLASSLQFPRHR